MLATVVLSGKIIMKLNDMQAQNLRIGFYVILPSSYAEKDLETIIKNHNLSLGFIRSTQQLERYATDVMKSEWISTVNGLSLGVDEDGRILFVLDLIDERNLFRSAQFDSLEVAIQGMDRAAVHEQRGDQL
jgi:hypothetical protein